MRLQKIRHRPREPDLTGLINIIFLILIFFMISGTLRPFAERGLKLAKISTTTSATTTPARIVAFADGRLTYRGAELALDTSAIAAAIAADPALDRKARFTLIADADLDAAKAMRIISALQSVGIADIAILTERRPH